jgi:hypothetical protein
MTEEISEIPDIPTTVIYRKNVSNSSKSFLIDTLLSKDEPARETSVDRERKRLEIVKEVNQAFDVVFCDFGEILHKNS